ncbi:hypothetical protein EDB87DRAFT_1651758 [Lactarius vividus]|nr:hypothetical protein EDB87DRAFT_1651758 [Lactarius vividus]
MGDVSSQVSASFEAREKYRYFRILVIGRANAGKTTLLKRVCNTTEEPCIYDEKSNSLRGIHDIDRPFAFASNPHQLKKVQSFIEKRAKSTKVDDQLHAIWYCFIPNKARFLLDLEKRFFNEQRVGNSSLILSFQSSQVFTKFDDLINQVYDGDLDEDKNREVAGEYKFPPRADVCLEDMHEDDGNHQEQVKVLIEKTAESLDDLALKILFVSLQQNNLELCVKYAVKYAPDPMWSVSMGEFVRRCLQWFRHSYLQNTKEVLAIVEKISDKPSITMFSALIICLENSFWYQSEFISFIDAFRKAFGIYTETATQEKVDIALKELGGLSKGSAFTSALSDILLSHRLPHPVLTTPNH